MWIVGFAVAAQAEDAIVWTPIPICGPHAPDINDIISNSPVWQCAKFEFAKSQSEYDTALKAYWARLPDAERLRFKNIVGVWNDADLQKCTKQNSLDFGCAISTGYERARAVSDALAKCGAEPCRVDDLP